MENDMVVDFTSKLEKMIKIERKIPDEMAILNNLRKYWWSPITEKYKFGRKVKKSEVDTAITLLDLGYIDSGINRDGNMTMSITPFGESIVKMYNKK